MLGLSSGRIEKRHSLAPVGSCQPFKRMHCSSLENMVTVSLSKRTLQPRSQSLPMPIKLCCKVGKIWQSRAVRVGRLRLVEAEEV